MRNHRSQILVAPTQQGGITNRSKREEASVDVGQLLQAVVLYGYQLQVVGQHFRGLCSLADEQRTPLTKQRSQSVQTDPNTHARATLDDAEFAALSAHYDDDQVLEIILLCGFYRTVSYLANALALPLEATAARFPQ